MKVFSADYLNKLTAQAQDNLRKRQHCNIHESYADPCQRLFNAIEPDSYIPPHRHATDPKDELLIAVRGSMAMVTFDEQGMVTRCRVSCDHIPRRSWALFRARDVMRGVIESFKAEQAA